MKIREIRATPVLVPLRRPLLHSNGTETGTARTVIELETDEGVVGIGETRGGATVAAMVAASRELWAGVDVLEAARIARRFAFYRVTSEQLHTVGAMKLAGAGIELACWDAAGQAARQARGRSVGRDRARADRLRGLRVLPLCGRRSRGRRRDGRAGRRARGRADRDARLPRREGQERRARPRAGAGRHPAPALRAGVAHAAPADRSRTRCGPSARRCASSRVLPSSTSSSARTPCSGSRA